MTEIGAILFYWKRFGRSSV